MYNGHPHGFANPAPQGGHPPPAMTFTRPFTLHEALPYTPFSSIAPFDSGVLPSPSIGSASPAPPVTDLVPGHDFATLNQEAAAQNPPSRRLQQAVSQVQHLLERGNIPELYVLFRDGEEFC
jgi:cohesin loading factor subunit SCC2